MCTVSFIGIDGSLNERDMAEMVEFLNVSSVLIRADHVSLVWTRWLKPYEIAVDRKIEDFRNKVTRRFSINPGCVKNGVSLPEEMIWSAHADIYVIGTTSEIKGYVESYLRLDQGVRGEVCREEDFLSPYIYQIRVKRVSADRVEVKNVGLLYKKA